MILLFLLKKLLVFIVLLLSIFLPVLNSLCLFSLLSKIVIISFSLSIISFSNSSFSFILELIITLLLLLLSFTFFNFIDDFNFISKSVNLSDSEFTLLISALSLICFDFCNSFFTCKVFTDFLFILETKFSSLSFWSSSFFFSIIKLLLFLTNN